MFDQLFSTQPPFDPNAESLGSVASLHSQQVHATKQRSLTNAFRASKSLLFSTWGWIPTVSTLVLECKIVDASSLPEVQATISALS